MDSVARTTAKNIDRTEITQTKIDRLVEKVDEGYGKVLIEQLTQRLDLAATEFSKEIEDLVERLNENTATQEELLGRIKGGAMLPAEDQSVPLESDKEITEWEKRLTRIEESAQ